LLIAILPRGALPFTELRATIETENRSIATLADAKRVLFLDIAAAVAQPDGSFPPKISPDGVHLSELGYERFATAIQPTILGLLRGKK